MEAKRKNNRKMDLLNAVEQIVELSKGSHLEKGFFTKAAKPLKFVADKMELTKEQSLMLALFELREENELSYDQVTQRINSLLDGNKFLYDCKSVWNCVRALLNDNMYALQDAKTWMSIWRTMLPALSDTDIRALATKYDFSGGQIENIARHYTIDGILNGESSVSFATLMAHCVNERLEQKEGRRIGFSV